MRYSITLVHVYISCFSFAQVQTADYMIQYDFRYITDTIAKTYTAPESYILYKVRDTSYFWNQNRLYNDSLLHGFEEKYPFNSNKMHDKKYMDKHMNRFNSELAPLIKKGNSNLRVLKLTNQDSTLVILDGAGLRPYHKQSMNPTWAIQNDQDTVHGMHCLKANIEYGGRYYTAWFTTEVPLSEGPYVFQGLPGLIIKVVDDENWYEFTLSKMNLQPVRRHFKIDFITEPYWQKPISRVDFIKESTMMKENPKLLGILNASPEMKLKHNKRYNKRFDLIIEQN